MSFFFQEGEDLGEGGEERKGRMGEESGSHSYLCPFYVFLDIFAGSLTGF